jgi:hypothetical protein
MFLPEDKRNGKNMEYLTLTDIKDQLRIEQEFTEEDKILTLYGESAENTIAQYLNRGKNAAEMVANLTEQYGGIPKPIIQATLMLVDSSYQHRSPSSPQNMYYVLYGFDMLIKPYMIL